MPRCRTWGIFLYQMQIYNVQKVANVDPQQEKASDSVYRVFHSKADDQNFQKLYLLNLFIYIFKTVQRVSYLAPLAAFTACTDIIHMN